MANSNPVGKHLYGSRCRTAVISVDDLHGSRAAPPGNLHAFAVELHEMTKATKELNEIIRSASLEPA